MFSSFFPLQRYVHYEVDASNASTIGSCNSSNNKKLENTTKTNLSLAKLKSVDAATTLQPPQWIQCDLRFLDMTVLGKFAVIMADPPWDIHMGKTNLNNVSR